MKTKEKEANLVGLHEMSVSENKEILGGYAPKNQTSILDLISSVNDFDFELSKAELVFY